MTIYFDKEHNAYGDELSIQGKTIVFTCEDSLWIDYNENEGKYIWVDDKIVDNPDWEDIQTEREKERVGKLSCTKRVLVLMLEQLGFDYYEQILPLIESNRQAKLEWELCERLERNNPLIDVVGEQLGISPEQIDKMFKYANGEITSLIDSEV